VSGALLNRAAVVMMQPSGSLPHDDHIHVRISCPRSIAGAGECIELAKNAPPRLAKGRRRVAPLVTPGGSALARGNGKEPTRKAAPPSREATAGKVGKRAAGGEALARVEAQEDRSESVLKRAFDAAAGGLLGGAREDEEAEADAAEADAVEAKGAADEGGAAKISD